jgi:nucleoid-associated protein YgaU
MGCVQQAVLEFDEEIQAPWRPRLVSDRPVVETAAREDAAPARPLRPHPSRRSPSRVGVCRPPESPTAGPVRRAAPFADARATARGGRPASRSSEGRRPAPGRAGAVRLRLTRRARRLAVVLAVTTGVALGSWLGPLLSGGEGGNLRLAGENSVVVESGDTLWSIASSLGGDGDVRARIDEIQRLNGLESGDLVPGQVLQLP